MTQKNFRFSDEHAKMLLEIVEGLEKQHVDVPNYLKMPITQTTALMVAIESLHNGLQRSGYIKGGL